MNYYDARTAWTNNYLSQKEMKFPSEYYIMRIFRGNYPRLKFGQISLIGKKICDVSFGDGRNILLLNECGFDICGTEISSEIVSAVNSRLNNMHIKADLRVGANDNIPFPDNYFDFLLSWNACYYMGKNTDFNVYVKEFSRVLKKDGYFVISIPKKTCFIYNNSEKLKDGYQIIRDDPFKIRNGEILRMFENEKEIENVFATYFKNFIFGSLYDDCFGLNYHHHLVICQKK